MIHHSTGYLPIHCAIWALKFATAEYLMQEHLGTIDPKGMGEVLPLLHLALFGMHT